MGCKILVASQQGVNAGLDHENVRKLPSLWRGVLAAMHRDTFCVDPVAADSLRFRPSRACGRSPVGGASRSAFWTSRR